MDQQTAIDDAAAIEAAGTEAEQDAAQAATEADAAFNAGFAEASGREPPAKPEEDQLRDEQHEKEDDKTGDEPGGEKPPGNGDQPSETATDTSAVDAPLTRAQVDQLLAEQRAAFDAEVRKLNGRYGNLNGRLEELAKRPGLTKADLAGLHEDGWEDVANALGKHLPDKHEDLPPLDDGTDDAPAPDTGAAPYVMPEDEQDRILSRLSPGWQQKLQSDGFAQWLSTLSATDQQAIADSNDPVRIADEIGRYDTWEAARNKKADEARGKRRRLDGAAQPTRGNPAAHVTEEDDPEGAFLYGWKTARGATVSQ